MKKIFLIIAITSLLTSCDDNDDKPATDVKLTNTYYGHRRKCITEITHNGCQYIGSFNGYNSDWGTHSGTCNNPIHTSLKPTK